MKVRNFISPRKMIIGFGASGEVGAEVVALGAKKVLLVTDKFLHEKGPVNGIKKNIEGRGIEVFVFDGTVPDPTVKNVEDAMQFCASKGCDSVVSVGGGSPTDVGKSVALLATNGGKIQDYMGFDKVRERPLPQIAVNTTAGTGSECSQTTVITDAERGIKMFAKSELIVPSVAIEDPELTISLPPKITAHTGLDALTHAIESYVSTEAFEVTEVLSLAAIEKIAKYLRRAWSDGGTARRDTT
ncbi:MAG: iron-containing alcohol dehydrogenase [Methanobacteriota archaeon]